MCHDGYSGVHCEEKTSKLFIRTGHPINSHSDIHESKFSYYSKSILKLM